MASSGEWSGSGGGSSQERRPTRQDPSTCRPLPRHCGRPGVSSPSSRGFGVDGAGVGGVGEGRGQSGGSAASFRHTAVQQRFWKSSSTTDASASVDTSPRSCSSQAILRRTRRMILPAGGAHRERGGGDYDLGLRLNATRTHTHSHSPERVLGSPGAFWM